MFSFSLLAIIQGLTEFLPISSSGHIVFWNTFLHQQKKIDLLWLVLVTHLATLFAILIFFRRDIVDLKKGFFLDLFVKGRDKKYLFFFFKIVLALLPTVLVGFFLKDFFKSQIFENLLLIGICFFITAIILYLPNIFLKSIPKKKYDLLSIPYHTLVVVGIAQMISILPGISRSGTTISVALLLGIKREVAFKISFLLSIPAILGSFLFEYKDMLAQGRRKLFDTNIIFCFFIAFWVGYFSLLFLKYLTRKNKLHYFSYYLVIMSGTTILIHFLYHI